MEFTWRAVPVAATILIGVCFSVAQQPSASLSRREQLQQYVTQLQANPSDDALRTKIIQLALTLEPKPAVPDEALKHEGAAEYAFKNAKSNAELTDAAEEYEKALLAAPWVAIDYFNSGVAYEKASEYKEAIRAYDFYLLAAPASADTAEVKKRIGGLEYALAQTTSAEKQQQAALAATERQRQQEAEAAQQRQLQYPFEGTWKQVSPRNISMFGDYVRVWYSGLGWKAARVDGAGNNLVGSSPFLAQNTSTSHFTLTVDKRGEAISELVSAELDLSADNQELEGRAHCVEGGDCGRSDSKQWFSIAFVRIGK